LLAHDPIFQSIRDERARARLVSRFDPELTRPEWALGFSFDIIVRGHDATPFEDRV
jgi:protocatechuate 3,4-dioxygenase beta subunit